MVGYVILTSHGPANHALMGRERENVPFIEVQEGSGREGDRKPVQIAVRSNFCTRTK